MLGIRHYKNIALDLWCGKSTDFSCDILIGTTAQQGSAARYFITKEALGSYFSALKEVSGRHLAVVPTELTGGEAKNIFAELKASLDEGLFSPSLSRISIVLPQREDYFLFQESFFAEFTESEAKD